MSELYLIFLLTWIPSLSHLDRFERISVAEIDQILEFNYNYRQYLQVRWKLYRHQDDGYALREAAEISRLWDLLKSAKSYYQDTDRQSALNDLVKGIGVDNFMEGRMPPPVPLWRFRQIR